MRCKVGDLAEVIGGALGLNNVGKVVEVTKFRGNHTQYGGIWLCRSRTGELITEYGAIGIYADFADDWLRPIPPVATPKAQVIPLERVEQLERAA